MSGHFGWSGMSMVEEEWRKGPWTADEDKLLNEYVRLHGEGRWNSVSRLTGLKRNGKSCRLRWVNYLRPDLKRGQITPHEETIILDLHARWGNRWSTIAKSLPGRTDNEIKNYWRTHFKNKTKMTPPCTSHEKIKARLLKKQQFQQQQQQQIQHLTQLDMIKSMMFLMDETTTEHSSRIPYMVTTPAAAEMAAATTSDQVSRTDDEQADPTTSSYYSTFILNNSSNFNNNSIAENMYWDGGLWNMEDDFHGSNNNSYAWGGLQQYIQQIHS